MKIKKILTWLLGILVVLYLIVCGLLYFGQEKILFHPTLLAKDFIYRFDGKFEEISIQTRDGRKLNSLLFKADSSKGIILYLHGNAGALDTWGNIAKTYTQLNYDIMFLDYRGFGKSEGEITGEEQFYNDVQAAYNVVKSKYRESDIIVLGYSIGTGPAAMLAARNHPKMLILQAPYYSLTDMMNHTYSFAPDFLLKYKFETESFVKQAKVPVVIFHGDIDEIIYYGSSLKLKQFLKPNDTLITLKGQGHNEITYNSVYQSELKRILSGN